jgi:hypothetical protein
MSLSVDSAGVRGPTIPADEEPLREGSTIRDPGTVRRCGSFLLRYF